MVGEDHLFPFSPKTEKGTSTTEHGDEMVEVFHNLATSLEFEHWKCNYVPW